MDHTEVAEVLYHLKFVKSTFTIIFINFYFFFILFLKILIFNFGIFAMRYFTSSDKIYFDISINSLIGTKPFTQFQLRRVFELDDAK